MAKLFISYRRKSWPFTHRLAEHLRKLLYADVFVDVDGVDETDFEQAILRHLRECNAVLVVISEYTFASDRIHQEKDWVRREIALALELRKPIVLVGVDGLVPPAPEDLPEDIRNITRQQSIEFYPRYFDAASKALAEFIARVTPIKLRRTVWLERLVIACVATVVVAALIGVGSSLLNGKPTSIATQRFTQIAQQTITPSVAATLSPSLTFTPTATPSATLTDIPTISVAEATSTLDAPETSTANAAATAATAQVFAGQTATAARWTATPTPNLTASIDAFRTARAVTAAAQRAHDLTATATLWTYTPTPTSTYTATGTPSNTLPPLPPPLAPTSVMLEDFEDGQTWWSFGTVFQYQPFQVTSQANPTCCHILKVQYNKANPYDFMGIDIGGKPIRHVFTQHSEVTVWVYGQVDIELKLEDSQKNGWGTPGTQSATNPNGWTLLRFNYSVYQSQSKGAFNLDDVTNLLFFVAPGNSTASGIIYLDDIELH